MSTVLPTLRILIHREHHEIVMRFCLHVHFLQCHCFPQTIVEIMQVVDAYALVEFPHRLGRHLGDSHRHRLLLALAVDSDRSALFRLTVPRAGNMTSWLLLEDIWLAE